MKPGYIQIVNDLHSLESHIATAYIHSNEISDDERNQIADELAFVTYEIRRQFELTSALYITSESKAERSYQQKFGEMHEKL